MACQRRGVSRRDFLRVAGAVAAGTLVAGCRPKVSGVSHSEEHKARVAIAQADDYDPKLIHDRVRDLLDGIGGLGDVIGSGDRVAIKVNLTGGVSVKPLPGVSPVESYVTHPEVVRALCGFVRDAGAREVFIVEAVYEWQSYTEWGYTDVADDVGAQLIDLNRPDPYSDFAATPVPDKPYVYDDFTFNPLLNDIDVFISVSKMKCHYCCGVTHTMKNLIGLVPVRFYTLTPADKYRSGFHGSKEQMPTRLPGVILDLNRARPVHLGLIDGIKTTEGGEGPWIKTLAPVQAHVLLASKDPVAVDAVATAVMGFDPTADMPDAPFLRAKNHLNMAHDLGLGTNRLEEISVVGSAIADVRMQFAPCRD